MLELNYRSKEILKKLLYLLKEDNWDMFFMIAAEEAKPYYMTTSEIFYFLKSQGYNPLQKITGIPSELLSGDRNIKSIDIPNNITSIGDEAFYYCTNLEKVIIPTSVSYIGNRAFTGCEKLMNIDYRGTKEQWEKINKHKDWEISDIITVTCMGDGQVIWV